MEVKKPSVLLILIIFYIFIFMWPKSFFIFVYTVFQLVVLYPEHLQLSFDCVIVACNLESIRPGLAQVIFLPFLIFS